MTLRLRMLREDCSSECDFLKKPLQVLAITFQYQITVYIP